MTTALLLCIFAFALFIGFHPVCGRIVNESRWFHPVCGRIVNESRWSWWRIMYLSTLLGVAVSALALRLMGWWG
jgi:hypothetical protein